jgi:hypothetical protein
MFIFFGIYFTPSIVGAVRGHKNLPAIFLLNLLFGWSVIGWGAAFIWAVIK